MILAPHALAGAAAAVILRKHPLPAVIAAFLSHFLLDAVPHWVYKLDSIKKDAFPPFTERFHKNGVLKDVFKTGVDFGIGLLIALLLSKIYFPRYFWLTFLGAAAGTLPDLLQFAYYIFPASPLSHLQRFHKAIHAKHSLDEDFLRGITYQISFSLAVVLIMVLVQRLF